MFEHSVKVPRHFKIAANIVKKVSTEGGSVKTLLYDEKLRHFRTNVLYALITETIKHAADIEKIFDTCGILVNEPRLDPWLAKVLTAELLFGKKVLPGKSKPEQTILSYKEQFEKCTPIHEDDLTSKVVRRPRYVRINTNLITTSEAIGIFQDEGYKFIRCTSSSYNNYLEQIKNLTEYDFIQDYHIKTMFVFAPGTKLHEHDLYLENQIILQDKATAMAVHLLAPPPGSVVLDMCAAPGMKTTQLAAYLRNQGKIYAVERNEKRYQTLCEFVEKTGSKCVETIHKDSLEIRKGDYDDVQYIILDPSCSGSGMELSVHKYIEDIRLAKLTSLQEKFLKHAMNSFPNAKRIVYSTCSLFPEENERVITNVVKTSRTKWRVQDVKELLKGQWNNFGSGMYGSMGTRCLYAKPEFDFTTGFFLAVLDREPRESHENSFGGVKNKSENGNDTDGRGDEKEEIKHKHNKKNQESATDTNTLEETFNCDESTAETPKKPKKKKKKESDDMKTEEVQDDVKNKKRKKDKSVSLQAEESINCSNDQVNSINDREEIHEEVEKKKKKKKKDRELNCDGEPNLNTDTISDQIEYTKKDKRKKRKKNENEEFVDNTDMNNDETVDANVDKNIDVSGNLSKKKKIKHKENVEANGEDDDIELVPKKKKKKHKEVSL